jgi:hypothetical protein
MRSHAADFANNICRFYRSKATELYLLRITAAIFLIFLFHDRGARSFCR